MDQPIWQKRFTKVCFLPMRIVVTTMGFFALVCAFTNRVSIAFVIIELAIPKNRTDFKSSGICPPESDLTKEKMQDRNKQDWSEEHQGFILGSFFIGYLIAHVPGGVLSDKFGSKWVLSISLLLSALCTIFTPVTINLFNQSSLIIIRILMGMAQGPLFPALASLLSHWVPPKERSTLGALCYSGVSVGIVASNLGSGFIIHYFTWALCLIIFGAATFCWMIVFILICASTPDKHLCIRKGEKDYLKKHISMQTESLTIPWHKILFSKALIALAISQIGHDWAFCLIVSYLPKYMADVLQFSILSNGLWTSLPFVALWFSSLICGFLADWLIRTGTMSITVERKVFTFISAFGPGAFMVIASYVECRKSLAVLFFTLSMFMMGPFYAGQKLTPIDMSPTYAGILTAICNGAGAVSGLLCPSIIGIMTPDRTTGQWRYVFWLSFAISVSSAIVFALWGSSDLQAYDPRAQRIRRRTKSHIPLDVFA